MNSPAARPIGRSFSFGAASSGGVSSLSGREAGRIFRDWLPATRDDDGISLFDLPEVAQQVPLHLFQTDGGHGISIAQP